MTFEGGIIMNVTIIPVGMLGTNCYLLESKQKNCVIFDPGAQPDKIIAIIEKAGLTPVYILLTHGHHDHIGAVNKLYGRFPGVKVYIGVNDYDMITDPQKSMAILRGQSANDFLIPQAETLEDGDEITVDELTLRVVSTPGHTKGGMCYLCGDLLFAGDTLFRRECGRCDLYGGNYQQMLNSLKRLSELPGDYTVYPGHGESTILSEERSHNPYMLEART